MINFLRLQFSFSYVHKCTRRGQCWITFTFNWQNEIVVLLQGWHVTTCASAAWSFSRQTCNLWLWDSQQSHFTVALNQTTVQQCFKFLFYYWKWGFIKDKEPRRHRSCDAQDQQKTIIIIAFIIFVIIIILICSEQKMVARVSHAKIKRQLHFLTKYEMKRNTVVKQLRWHGGK